MRGRHHQIWVFGYGSLIWKPEIAYTASRPARLRGWKRRFWQGSHDHRGVPHAPGRVVTLLRDVAMVCEGVAFRLDEQVADATFAGLDHREKNGYTRQVVDLETHEGDLFRGVVYIATPENEAYLGPASLDAIAAQICSASGPSGTNVEYLTRLAQALRELDVIDEHVFELERLVRPR